MPRRPRIHLAGLPVHVVQRGHNREACFFTEEDFQAYRDWLAEALADIRLALNQGQPLGGERFLEMIEKMTGQRRKVRQRGRPRKEGSSAKSVD